MKENDSNKHDNVIKTILEDSNIGIPYAILNIYGSFNNRRVYGDNLTSNGLWEDINMVIGGDLNLTISEREVWGKLARLDFLSNFFIYLFDLKGLVDVQPIKLEPT